MKLINYSHLSNFSHFVITWTLFNIVLIPNFPIPFMENTLFPRYLEKQKFLLRSISRVAMLTRDIANYPYLSEASTSDHYSTTHLQYSVVKIFKNLYKYTVRRLQVHEIYPAYELTPLDLLDGPLQLPSKDCAIIFLTIYNFYLNTFSTQMLIKYSKRNMTTVWNYSLECVKLLRILFHLNTHKHV